MTILELEKQANEVRKGIVEAIHAAKSGHPGGSLSSADIMTYLYFEEMNIDPQNPKMEDRDRFVLSKGHVAPAYYSALAHRGFFPVEDLLTLRHTGSYLQGHPDMKQIPGVDMSSGSLGQGLSCAVGMAQARSVEGKPTAIIARTIKGKNVSFMEDVADWHGKAPSDEQFAEAMADLQKAGEALCHR